MPGKKTNSFIRSLIDTDFYRTIKDFVNVVDLYKDSQDETERQDAALAQDAIKAYYETYAEIYPNPLDYDSAIESLREHIKKGA